MKSVNVRKIFGKAALILVVFATFISSLTAQLPTGVQRVTSVEGITEYRLPNGLQVLLFPDVTKQNLTVNIVYRVGSRHEGYGETGMAHLLEHLVFKGTPKHPNIPAELTTHGAIPNGTTWYDRTNYYETVAATDENLDWALDLEADRMINSFISKKDLDSEFSVVRNEMEAGENSPAGVVIQRMTGAAYQWHNYGKTTIGARSDVENVKIENLQAFYRKYYQPDNATLIVAGKIDEAKTLELINKKFGSIPKPTRVLEPTWTSEPPQDGERQVTVRRVGDSQFVFSGYHVPPSSHPDFPAVIVMTRILSDTPSGRLYKALVETKKASSIFNQTFQNKEPSYSIFGVQVDKNKSTNPVRDALLATVEEFGKTPISKEEVERQKVSEIKSIDLAFNDPNSVGLMLTDWVARGDWRLLFLYRDRMKKVSAEDVQRVSQKYLLQSNRTLGFFIPDEKPVRAEVPRLNDTEILAMADEVKGGATIAAGEVFDPTPTNIEARTKRGQIGGLKTAFVSKKTRGETVMFRINLRLADEKSLMNRGVAGLFAAELLMRGTTTKSRQQIKEEFDRLRSQGGVFGSQTSVGGSVTTDRTNLPETLKFVAELLKEPAYSQAEFDQLKQEVLVGAESGRSEPGSIASRAMGQAFNKYPKGDYRYAGTIDEDIAAYKAVTLEDVKRFHKDFYGASTGEFAIVGDFDEAEVKALLSQHFGNWKSPKPFIRSVEQYKQVAAVDKSFETPDKPNAIFMARITMKMSDSNPDYPAFALGNFILGGGFLNSRLATRIRQKDGLSYGVSSSFSVSSMDETGAFTANAIYAPQNVKKLELAFREELDRVLKDGFTDEEVAQAKAGWLLAQKRSRGNDAGIANILASYLFINRTYAWQEEFERKVEALTPEQLHAAMKRWLIPENISVFKAGDFAKAGASK